MRKFITNFFCMIFIVAITTSCINQRTQVDADTLNFCRMIGKYSQDAFVEYSHVNDTNKVDQIYKYVLVRTLQDHYESSLNMVTNPNSNNTQVTSVKESYDKARNTVENAFRSGEYKNKDEQYALYKNLSECDSILNTPEDSSKLNNIIKFRNYIKEKYLPLEKKLFSQRTKGHIFCGEMDMEKFTFNVNRSTPDEGCITWNEGWLVTMQSTPEGILARSVHSDISPMNATNVYLYKENNIDKNIVDGERIASGYFEYKGVITYPSFLGFRSVRSFKRVNISSEDLFDNIYFYDGR